MKQQSISKTLSLFEEIYDQQVSWRVGISFRKYAKARDELVTVFVENTGLDEKVFYDHLAFKQAREMRVK